LAFNGSGTFVRVHDWTTDLTNLVPVTASRADAEDDGFATGLSLTICRDGQSTTTARIPFASGISAAAGTASAAALAQTGDLNTGLYFPATDSWGLTAGGTGTLTSTSTALTATGTLALSGDFAINTNKFTAEAATGNVLIAGTLSVTGTASISGGLTAVAPLFNGTTTISGGITTVAACTAARASINIPGGTDPSAPANGDMWFDGTSLKFRAAGVTRTITWA